MFLRNIDKLHPTVRLYVTEGCSVTPAWSCCFSHNMITPVQPLAVCETNIFYTVKYRLHRMLLLIQN